MDDASPQDEQAPPWVPSDPMPRLELRWWERWPWIAMLGSAPLVTVMVDLWFHGSRASAVVYAAVLAVGWYTCMRWRAALFMGRQRKGRRPME